MAEVSLLVTGAQLGKTTGEVSLGALRAQGYTRTFAVGGYLRVNPFEVEASRAQDPAEAGTEHRLGEWLGYDQDRIPAGAQLAHTLVPGGVELSWTKPAGYDRAPAILDQQVYAKDTGQTTINEPALSVNPFSLPDTSQSAGDGTTKSLTLASFIGQVVAIGMKAEFDDSVSNHTSPDQNSYTGAVGENLLTGGGTGIAVGPILPTEPTVGSLTQDPSDPATCQVGADITLEVNLVDSFGEVFLSEAVDGGGFGADFSVGVINDNAQIDLVRQSGHTYTIRARYSGGAYSPSKNHFLECTLL